MKTLEKISSFLGKYMAVVVLFVAALALFKPETCLWIDLKWINYLLMIVMFGMGLTLKFDDFKIVFTRPKDIAIGCVAQFAIMPILAYLLGKAFALDDALLVGVVLVGACPGGTASNVMTYFSKGDVALSVGMTSVNTLLAPLLTPALVYLSLRTSIDVDVASMFISIVEVVLAPIGIGLLVDRFFGSATSKAAKILPMVSVIAITAIVASVVSHNAKQIVATGAVVASVVILHNLLGYACGYAVGKLIKAPLAKRKALSIEIGMQNSGLATSLAKTSFPTLEMATVPGAIFSVWHNISGACLAFIFARLKEDEPKGDGAAD